MKKIYLLISTVIIFLFYGICWADSIVYDGFECLNPSEPNDPASQEIPLQSRFEVTESLDEGLYRLRLTGGIPRFVNNDATVCIDRITSLGFSGIPTIDGLPVPLQSVDATGYLNGYDLIVVVNAMVTDLSARRDPLSAFSTSRIFAYSHTLIFESNALATLFILKKTIRNRGYTQTSGTTNSFLPFLETILPSFNNELLDKPQILTPVATIQYRLE